MIGSFVVADAAAAAGAAPASGAPARANVAAAPPRPASRGNIDGTIAVVAALLLATAGAVVIGGSLATIRPAR
jgi:hypothetical protein